MQAGPQLSMGTVTTRALEALTDSANTKKITRETKKLRRDTYRSYSTPCSREIRLFQTIKRKLPR